MGHVPLLLRAGSAATMLLGSGEVPGRMPGCEEGRGSTWEVSGDPDVPGLFQTDMSTIELFGGVIDYVLT